MKLGLCGPRIHSLHTSLGLLKVREPDPAHDGLQAVQPLQELAVLGLPGPLDPLPGREDAFGLAADAVAARVLLVAFQLPRAAGRAAQRRLFLGLAVASHRLDCTLSLCRKEGCREVRGACRGAHR